MSTTDTLIAETAERLFADASTGEIARSAEAGRWPEALWDTVEAAGFADALLLESGVSLSEAMTIVRIAARHAAPIPLAETMVARLVLAGAGLAVPPGPLTIDAGRADLGGLTVSRAGDVWHLDGVLHRVPFLRDTGRVLAHASTPSGPMIMVASTAGAALTLGRNLAGEARDDVRFSAHPVEPGQITRSPSTLDRDALYRWGALVRSAQIVGALEAALEMSVRYANERVQFGRPIGKFQAIQHQLALLGGEVAVSAAALDRAIEAQERDAPSAPLAIAAAKSRASEAAGTAAAIAHQVHGAIGFTHEFALQLLTRRLWSWRDEFGAEAEWNRVLGEALMERSKTGLWPALASL